MQITYRIWKANPVSFKQLNLYTLEITVKEYHLLMEIHNILSLLE